MGTIVSRQRKDKTTAFMAKISIMRDGKIVHRENKTFDRKQAAAAWIVKREEELSKPGEIDRANADRLTLADAIDKYVGENVRPIGRTKAQVLKTTKTFHIASMDCAAIKSQHIVEFATELGRSRKPQTVGNYLSHLSSIFAIARPAWNVDLDYQAMKDAQVVLKRLGIIKSSDKNERRPTLEEMNRIMDHYDDREKNQPLLAPMRQIIAFALFSTRRQDEIMRIRWDDFDAEGKRVLVRDMKNPGEKFGNDVWCDLPDPACDIIKAMPKVRAEIFPYNAASISASFTRTCNLLEIDIDFHRLRHEGISRLFEMGAGIPQAAAVSGHRSWTSLKRYAHIRQTGDKYADWPWIKEVVKPARAGSRPMSKRTKRSRGLPVD